MAESTLAIKYSDLLRELGRMLGWGRDPGKWKPDDRLDAADCIKGGLNAFYFPLHPIDGKSHRWSFLDPLQTFSSSEPYSTGTVTIVNGVVTLAGGTFPSWAAGGDLRIGGVSYSVNTRDSGTQVTLDDTTLDASAGTEYELVQQVYDLPADFAGLMGPITFRAGQTNFRTEIQQRSDIEVRRLSAEKNGSTDEPCFYAIRPKVQAASTTTGQRWELIFDCPTDAAYTFEYRYSISPNTLDTENEFPLGGAVHRNTILEAVLAEAELKLFDNESGPHNEKFKRLLAASIEQDRSLLTPDSLGVDTGDPLISGPRVFPRQVRTYFEGAEIA